MSEDKSSESTSEVSYQVVTDAAHPLFLEPNQKSVSTNTWKYQCSQCNERLVNKDSFLKIHFEKTYHKEVSECRKCGGNIYEYLDHNARALYHKCRKKDEKCVQDMNQNYTTSGCDNAGDR